MELHCFYFLKQAIDDNWLKSCSMNVQRVMLQHNVHLECNYVPLNYQPAAKKQKDQFVLKWL